MIDGAAGTVVANVDVRTRTRGVAANPRTNRVYVTSLDASGVMVVDGTSHAVVDTLLTPSTSCGIAVNAHTNRVYVSTQETGSVSCSTPPPEASWRRRRCSGRLGPPSSCRTTSTSTPKATVSTSVNKTAGSLVAANGDLVPS